MNKPIEPSVLSPTPLQPTSAPIPADFTLVPGGTFLMGSPGEGSDDERPQHQATVSSFLMGKYQVTQREYTAVTGMNPSYFKRAHLPVETVSWYDVIDYCNKRSRKEGLSPAYTRTGNTVTWNRQANGYRLPTEAEWEYAARGGNASEGYTYAGSNDLNAVAWYSGNSGSTTHEVGTKDPNELGLYDMSGNVWEWCWDWYGSYSGGSQTDPVGPHTGDYRVLRGGSWSYDGWGLLPASRIGLDPADRYIFLGIRLVRSAP